MDIDTQDPQQMEDIASRLNSPFPASVIKQKPGPRNSTRTFSYVTARDVAERLDQTVGWQNWQSMCDVVDQDTCAVRCQLTILGVTKSDIGYPNSGTDAEDPSREPLKAAASDALKRAAVLFGVGRHLYRDGAHGDAGGATGVVRQGQSAGRAPSPKQVQYLTGLLQQHGFPTDAVAALDGATASAWIDEIRAHGPGAKLTVPATGEILSHAGGHAQENDPPGYEPFGADDPAMQGNGHSATPDVMKPATANQLSTIAKLSRLLGHPEETADMTVDEASAKITALSREYNDRKTAAGVRR